MAWTALHYARVNGLTRNFQQEHPLNQLRLPYLHVEPEERGVEWYDHATSLVPALEKWTLDREAAVLLSSVMKYTELINWPDQIRPSQLPNRTGKRELPILSTDPELDQLRFSKRPGTNPEKMRESIPKWPPMDIENDKLLRQAENEEIARHASTSLEREKLHVTRDALLLLRDIQQHHWTAAEVEQMFQGQRCAVMRPDRKLSPPLLPAQSEPSFLSLRSNDGDLELWSDISGLTLSELEAANTRIFVQDEAMSSISTPCDKSTRRSIYDLGDTSSERDQHIEYLAAPLCPKRKHVDLKVEVPLLPLDTAAPSMKIAKTVSFTSFPHEVIPENLVIQQNSDEDAKYQALFNEFIQPLGKEGVNAVNNEKLRLSDAVRVKIPRLPDYHPPRPWHVAIQRSHDERERWPDLAVLNRDPVLYKWPDISAIERKLYWKPLSAVLQASNDDEPLIYDEQDTVSYLQDITLGISDFIDSLTWKPSGQGPFGRCSSRYIEPIDIAPINLASPVGTGAELVGKSYVAVSNNNTVSDSKRVVANTKFSGVAAYGLCHEDPHAPSTEFQAWERLINSKSKQVTPGGRSETRLRPQQDLSSSFDSFNHFMLTQGQRGTSPTHNNVIAVSKPDVSSPPITPQAISVPTSSLQPPDQLNHSTNHVSLQGISDDLPVRYCIVSMSFVQIHRHLLRALRELYPRLEVLERDFEFLQSSSIAEASEADVLLAPGMGVILTSLQKIKQKSLPGQACRNNFRDRLAAISLRYERLVVLVIDQAHEYGSVLDSRDTEAIAALTGFTSQFAADVNVIYIPNGDRNAACIILRLIVALPPLEDGFAPANEGTYWELLLRRIGFDTFATQAICYSLREQDLPTQNATDERFAHQVSGGYGLRAFLRMSAQERLLRYEPMMQGRRVLERVNGLLETKWSTTTSAYDLAEEVSTGNDMLFEDLN